MSETVRETHAHSSECTENNVLLLYSNITMMASRVQDSVLLCIKCRYCVEAVLCNVALQHLVYNSFNCLIETHPPITLLFNMVT